MVSLLINLRTFKAGGGGGSNESPPIGFTDLNIEAFNQSKLNFQLPVVQ